RLKAVLEGYKIPLVVSYGREDVRLTEDEIEFLDAYLPAALRGFANLVSDDLYDGTVRDIYPGRALPDGSFVPGIATRLVQKLGKPVEPVPRALAYRGQPAPEIEPFRELPSHNLARLPAN